MSAATPADPVVRPPKRGGISAIWLVPLVALAIALLIAWQAISSRGPLIEVSFANVDGLEAGASVLKYRDVTVGTVEDISFGEDLDEVLVGIRLDQDIAPYVDAEAQFWVVRPEVTARGISGLGTVLSGVYIQGNWDNLEGEAAETFEGLSRAPLVTDGRDGIEILLTAPSGGRLSQGAPVVYKGVTVGYLDAPELSELGDQVTAKAFIEAPFDRLLNSATRFWEASGFSVSVGASGLSLDVASLAALVEGGVGFGTVLSGGSPIAEGASFAVFPSETDARSSIFEATGEADVPFSVFFDGSISGLSTGAPVEFQGLRVGSVSALGAQVVEEEDGRRVRLRVTIGVDPQRLGLPEGAGADGVLDFLEEAVGRGLRARLASANLLGTSLKVELVTVEGTLPGAIDRAAQPNPVLPAADPVISDVQASAEGVLARISDLPIEESLQSVNSILASVSLLLSSEEVRATPAEVLGLIGDAREVVTSVPVEGLVTEAQGAVADLRAVVARLNDGAAIDALLAALARTDTIARSVEDVAAGLPPLLEEIQTVAANAAALPLNDLVTSATSLVDTANGLVGSAETAQVPVALAAALDELALTLAELREGGAVQNVNATLASATAAAAAVEDAAAGLPALAERVDSLSRSAQSVLNGYGERSDFNTQTLAAIRDLRDAARAVTSLSRAIERNPDSLLRGR